MAEQQARQIDSKGVRHTEQPCLRRLRGQSHATGPGQVVGLTWNPVVVGPPVAAPG